MPVIHDLVRAKSAIRNDDEEGLFALISRLDDQLAEVEREYA